MKSGNWIALDKRLAVFLPINRPYTMLEAMFSYTKDCDENKEKALREYARIWSWSRTKVESFVEKIKATKKPEESQKKASKEPEFRFIFNNLADIKSQQKATKKPEESQQKATTINPNPNPFKKPLKPSSPDAIRLAEKLADYILENNPSGAIHLQNGKRAATVTAWSSVIDKLNRLDKQEWSDIEKVIDWCQKDSFWKVNILSANKLREKYAQLSVKMNVLKLVQPARSAEPPQTGTVEYAQYKKDLQKKLAY
jgi:hypothetical protein